MKLISPQYPASAIGLESGSAAAVLLERRRGSGYSVRRAATLSLPPTLLKPGFDEQNVMNGPELAGALSELAMSAGMGKQRKWSVALPEAAARAIILTMESAAGSRAELEQILNWKMERGFGVPLDELRIAKERLPSDAQGRVRYLAVGLKLAVLAEYESVFEALGWRAGLILPRHVGESRWLVNGGTSRGDQLLVSSHAEGFTALLLRASQPLLIRSIICEAEDRDDELYRLLLFYRDRLAAGEDGAAETRTTLPEQTVQRLLVVGDGFNKNHVSEIVNDTLGLSLHSLGSADVGLSLPSDQLSFDQLAAPAGLATLAW